MSSLALLPPRQFAVFERQRAKNLTMYCFTSSLAAWSQYIPNNFSSVRKVVCKLTKCKQTRQYESPYIHPLGLYLFQRRPRKEWI